MGAEPGLGAQRVAIARLADARYPTVDEPHSIAEALGRAGSLLGWSDDAGGPFANRIGRGARVLVKPNWVLHTNQGAGGFEPLVTHGSLISAVVDAVLQTAASTVVVGDAPVQGCNFPALLRQSGLDTWAAGLQGRDPRFMGLRDFRRTVVGIEEGVRRREENRIPTDRFVLFDLGSESLLEPISDDRPSFRVTQYDPTLLRRTHTRGRHQYLIAREVLEADVIINLPKLKTHKKAGVTCSLKNLIGINGNKEFLPHHRVGGAGNGGDCYPGRSRFKRLLEFAYDRLNSTTSDSSRAGWALAARLLDKARRLAGDELGVEGSWSGNDTIWRTCLDLNRIAVYGRADGTLAATPQRTVLQVVDAVVAGHGDGPLAPDPLPLGLLLVGDNAPAVDWVGAALLGYAPSRIPACRQAYSDFTWPLVSDRGERPTTVGDLGSGPSDEILAACAPPGVTYPVGWQDAVANGVGDVRVAASISAAEA